MSILSAAADVLRCFSSTRHDVTVTDLVTLLGMPKSNASRLLRAMRDEGLLETVGDSKRYRPSLLLNQVGQIYRFAASLIDRADAVVGDISDRIGHTGYISVRRAADIVAVTAHPGRHALRVVTAIGDRIPAFASSTGRALLARLTDEEVRMLYPGGFAAPSDTAPRDMDELLARLAVVRSTGFAESHDEAVRGVHAVSVAVGDPATGDEVALCMSFPAAIVEPAERLAIIRSLGQGAAEIAALTQDKRFYPLDLSIAETAP
ncbi:IclR family transcriptional regulator [Bosea sp. (in: a-proteobacteria)]|uniref:IclR family transcriptional regulator n=1 Tax=Bosea sp. (in: a-proteobacteria) TaxID=1871050 RepID=UPI001AC93267|nr:IclR family transcriptional regulator [Bosea sp. (in: a-proteobacteria)]MBN9441570.1 IclR family transcriptional regulator [Bosea sp. (in: a-proteobacteria)]